MENVSLPSTLYQSAYQLKASFICPRSERAHFGRSIAQLTISVGQAVHEGEKLKATLACINKFAGCKIMIDDSIQSYTLAISAPHQSPAICLAKAIQAGDDYLAAHADLFNAHLTIPFEIIRWRDFLTLPAWRQAIDNMHRLYQDDLILKAAIHQTADAFLARYERTRASKDYRRDLAEQLCIQYLLEECAVMKEIWIGLGCHYEVYPSPRNQAMATTYERYIAPTYPHLLKPVALRFNKKWHSVLSLPGAGNEMA
jgi:hypothetical protein